MTDNNDSSSTLLDWFAQGNRLIGLVVATTVLAVAALGYTYSADQQSEDRTDDVVSCIARYIAELTEASAPRTLASIAANDARFNWDAGTNPQHPTWSKERLKAEYVRLYKHYQDVTAKNPPVPEFNLIFCEGQTDG